MAKLVHKPLIRRIAMALAGVVALALVSILSSMLIAESTSGDAAAINDAGSLRMHSWRIASVMQSPESSDTQRTELADEFEQRAARSELFNATHKGDPQLRSAYQQIAQRWRTELRPLVIAGDVDGYLQAVAAFVAEIDAMVELLEQTTESKIRVLRTVQFLSLGITLLVVALTIHSLQKNIATPLKQMVDTVARLGAKDLDARFNSRREDELGLLGKTLNEMADELAQLYSELEQRVADKTEKLQSSNRALQLLYETTRTLNCRPQDLQQRLPKVVENLQQVTGLRRAILCLIKEGADNAYQYLTSDQSGKPHFCTAPTCVDCLPKQFPCGTTIQIDTTRLVKVAVATKSNHFGHILVELNDEGGLSDSQRQLVDAVADIVASSISIARQADQAAKLLLMEERAVIARELHDSLAQSLSYQKIQVTRARKLHQRGAGDDQIYSALDDLQDGLNAAYRQLRDLLTTFRLKPEQAELANGIANAVEEFSERGSTAIELDYQLQHCPLTANEEIHLLQIIREGLSNVVQHAQASLARLRLSQTEDGRIEVVLQDNGIGIPDNPDKENHFGMVILRERAQKLHARLQLTRNETGGTTLSLQFAPQFLQQASHHKYSSQTIARQ